MNWWNLESTGVASSICARQHASERLSVRSGRSVLWVLEESPYGVTRQVTVTLGRLLNYMSAYLDSNGAESHNLQR